MSALARMDAALRRWTEGGAGDGPAPRATGLRLLWRRMMFTKATRAETWQLLADVLEAKTDLSEMLGTVAEGYALEGKGTIAATLRELQAGMGRSEFNLRLRPYCGLAERILFEEMGRLDAAALLSSAARILRMELAMRKALVNAIAMPVLLVAGLVGLALFFGLELLPVMAEVVDFDILPPVQKTVVDVVLALSANPTGLLIWIAGLTVGLAVLMRVWTGLGRAFADKFPPFSVMRLQAGAGFLFAVVETGRAGADVDTDLFERMAAASGRYARSRILALSREYRNVNNNLGSAALAAGQGFPSPQLSVVLRVLWNKPGGIERAAGFLERWLSRVEDRVKAAMAVLNVALLCVFSVVLLLLLSVMMPVFEQLNTGASY